MSVIFILCSHEMHVYILQFHSQDSPQQQQTDQNNAAMDLINSVVGVDEEGRSRQRILTFAARRYHDHFYLQFRNMPHRTILATLPYAL